MTTVPARPAQPVFVDATGTRRRRIRRAGVLVALASLSYLPMAASALLPGPATPMLPGPLSVAGTPDGGTVERVLTAPTPLRRTVPAAPPREDTVDGRRAADAPTSKDLPPGRHPVAPPVGRPSTRPPTRTTSPTPPPVNPALPTTAAPPATAPPATPGTTPPTTTPGLGTGSAG